MRPNSPPQTTSVWSSRPAPLQVLQQPGDRLVHGPAGLGVVLLDAAVRVPLAAGAAVDLDEADAALDQAAGQQAEPAGRSRPPGRPGRRGIGSRRSRPTGRRPRAPRPACGRPARSCGSGRRARTGRTATRWCRRLSRSRSSSLPRCRSGADLGRRAQVGDRLGSAFAAASPGRRPA